MTRPAQKKPQLVPTGTPGVLAHPGGGYVVRVTVQTSNPAGRTRRLPAGATFEEAVAVREKLRAELTVQVKPAGRVRVSGFFAENWVVIQVSPDGTWARAAEGLLAEQIATRTAAALAATAAPGTSFTVARATARVTVKESA